VTRATDVGVEAFDVGVEEFEVGVEVEGSEVGVGVVGAGELDVMTS